MLGEKFHESKGKITGQRVLPNEGGGVKVETSFQTVGKLFGVDAQDLGTYSAVMTPAGVLQGEGQGVTMTRDGESVTWRGIGTGKPNPKGGIVWRASLTYQTASPKFAKLNQIIGVVEFETDAEGNSGGSTWEWK